MKDVRPAQTVALWRLRTMASAEDLFHRVVLYLYDSICSRDA